ncbi:MAG: hypothetical protein IPO07_15860 [Haliscomenobacter sp.]|nr:hypothetical protein [Haliscomenobacter sp.]MBK9490076.1 hypothetical protein [Haliscomenobacter sp.]
MKANEKLPKLPPFLKMEKAKLIAVSAYSRKVSFKNWTSTDASWEYPQESNLYGPGLPTGR